MNRHTSTRSSQNATAGPSDEELKQIIESNDLDSAQLMVIKAQEMGAYLQRDLKTAQIRGIFNYIRQIEMNWPVDATESDVGARQAMRDLVLLKPKMAYQAQRINGFSPLAELLTRSIDLVGAKRENFQRLIDFFEAILAYHRAAEGRK